MKKIIAVILSVLMLVSVLPMATFAADTKPAETTTAETTTVQPSLTDIINSLDSIENPWENAEEGTMEYYMGILFTLVQIALKIAAISVFTFDSGKLTF